MQKILDEAKRKQIIGVLAVGGTRTLAAKLVGCDPRTLYNTAKADPKFAEEIIQAETCPEYHLLRKLSDADQPHAIKWKLERVYPDRYRPRNPGVFSVDAVKQLLVVLAARLAEQAASDDERRRTLATISQVGKEMIVNTQPFVEQAIAMYSEIGDLANATPTDPPADVTTASAAQDSAAPEGQKQEHNHAQ